MDAGVEETHFAAESNSDISIEYEQKEAVLNAVLGIVKEALMQYVHKD